MPKPERTTKQKNTEVGLLMILMTEKYCFFSIFYLLLLLFTTYHAAVFLPWMFLHFRNEISGLFPDESISYMNYMQVLRNI